jgi:hypothetical protein
MIIMERYYEQPTTLGIQEVHIQSTELIQSEADDADAADNGDRRDEFGWADKQNQDG